MFVSILIIVDLLFIAFFCSVLSKEERVYLSQNMLALYILKHGHLLDSYLIELMPIAPVNSIHREGLNVNALLPVSLKRGSNSTPLKFGV